MSNLIKLKNEPKYNINIIDMLKILDIKPKYIELLLKLSDKNDDFEKYRIIDDLHYLYDIDNKKLKEKNSFEIRLLLSIFQPLFNDSDDFISFKKFVSLNENKLIERKDITSYNSISEIKQEVSIAEIKQLDKLMEKQIIKLYETDEWLVIKPLTWESSLKYGSSTRWCIAGRSSEDLFYRYARGGIIIYSLNKKTGYRVATYKNIVENELTFWNAEDRKIDSIQTPLSHEVMDIIKENVEGMKTNWDFLSNEDKTIIDKRLGAYQEEKLPYNPDRTYLAEAIADPGMGHYAVTTDGG